MGFYVLGSQLYWSQLPLSSKQRKITVPLPYWRGGPWLCKVWGSNMLTARLVRSVTGHAPIAAYRAHFRLGDLPMEDGFLVCPCGSFEDEMVRHVINSCGRYDRHPTKFHISRRGDFLPYVEFLQQNPGVFSFRGYEDSEPFFFFFKSSIYIPLHTEYMRRS